MTQTSFSADLSRFGVTVDKRMTSLIRQTALGMLDELHSRSPVLTGWLRASWQVSVNKKATGVYSYYSGSWVSGNKPQGNRPDPRSGVEMGIPAQKEMLAALKWTDKVVFTNNVPYTGLMEEKYMFIATSLAHAKNSLYAIAGRLAK